MTRKAIARRQWLFEYNCICWGKLTDHPSGMFAVRGSAGKGFLSPDFLRRRGKLTDHPSGMFAMRGSAGKGFLLPTFLFLKKKSTEEKYG